MVWKICDQVTEVKNHNYLLTFAFQADLEAGGDFDTLDLLLSMDHDFNMYAQMYRPPRKTVWGPPTLLCFIWKEYKNLSIDAVTKLLELLIMKHKFDLNKSSEFNRNLMKLMETHSKHQTVEDEQVRQTATQSAEEFSKRLGCLSVFNQFGYSYLRQQNSEQSLIDSIQGFMRPHGNDT